MIKGGKMNKDILVRYITEIMNDYDKFGKEKPTMEWFREAIKRHIIDVTDTEVDQITDKLIKGITAYRTERERSQQASENVSSANTDEQESARETMREESHLLADALINDLGNASVKGTRG